MKQTAEVVLTGVTVEFTAITALADVTVRLGEPGVTGLIGANGAGKTTLIHVVLGLLAPTSGDVSGATQRIAYCPDTPSFEPFLTASEVLKQSAALGSPERRRNPLTALRRVGLAEAADRRIGGFSRGMKQRLGVAASLVSDPDLLILDEPTSALDPAGREEMMDLIRTLGSEHAVVFSSHILSDVERVADRLIVLDRGALLYSGSAAAMIESRGVDDRVTLSLEPGSAAALADLADAGVRLSSTARENVRELPAADLSRALAALSAHPGAVRRVEVGERSLQRAYDALIAEGAA